MEKVSKTLREVKVSREDFISNLDLEIENPVDC
jgi:hypothetical protein